MESISSAVVVVARIQVSVISRTSGFTLSVRSLSAVMCKGVSIDRVLRMHNKRVDGRFGPGLSVRRPQVEQLRDEKERVSWVEKEKMYVWVGAESTMGGS